MKKEVMTSIYTKNEEEINFAFYTSLKATDKMKFVNLVTNTLVGDNYYHSIIRDLIFDFAIISVFTDVDTSYIEDSVDTISLVEDLLNETNIVEIVKANAEEGLLEELNKAVDDAIEYRTGIHRNSFIESLAHLLKTLEKKISVIDTEEMMNAAQVLGKLTGEITPEKVLEAYTNSDIFKKNQAEIMETKQKHNAKIDAIKAEEEKRKANKAKVVNKE